MKHMEDVDEGFLHMNCCESGRAFLGYCDCMYCRIFGQELPPTAPTSKNYEEVRERLRLRLSKKKLKSKSSPDSEIPQSIQKNLKSKRCPDNATPLSIQINLKSKSSPDSEIPQSIQKNLKSKRCPDNATPLSIQINLKSKSSPDNTTPQSIGKNLKSKSSPDSEIPQSIQKNLKSKRCPDNPTPLSIQINLKSKSGPDNTTPQSIGKNLKSKSCPDNATPLSIQINLKSKSSPEITTPQSIGKNLKSKSSRVNTTVACTQKKPPSIVENSSNTMQDTRALKNLLESIEGNEIKCRDEKKAAKKERQKEKKFERKKIEEEEQAKKTQLHDEELKRAALEEAKKNRQREKEVKRNSLEEEAKKSRLHEEELKRKALEEEAKKSRLREEDLRRKALEEELKRKALEEQAKKTQLHDEELKRAALEEAKKNRQREKEVKRNAREEEAKKSRLHEEDLKRKALEEEAKKSRLREEDLRRKALEEELKRKALEEQAKKTQLHDEELKRAALEEAKKNRQREKEVKRNAREEEAKKSRLHEEDLKRKALEEEAKKSRLREEDLRRKALEEELKRKALEEQAKKTQLHDEELKRAALEEAKKNRQREKEVKRNAREEEAKKSRLHEEELKRKALEEEAKKSRLREEDLRRKALEEELKRKAQEEQAKKTQLHDEELKRAALEEAKKNRQREKEVKRNAREEEAKKSRLHEEELKRKALEEEAKKSRLREEDLRRKALEEELKRKALEKAKRKQIEEANAAALKAAMYKKKAHKNKSKVVWQVEPPGEHAGLANSLVNKPSPQMVKVKRVFSEPTVTTIPNQDRLLYTLLNGQVRKFMDMPLKKISTKETQTENVEIQAKSKPWWNNAPKPPVSVPTGVEEPSIVLTKPNVKPKTQIQAVTSKTYKEALMGPSVQMNNGVNISMSSRTMVTKVDLTNVQPNFQEKYFKNVVTNSNQDVRCFSEVIALAMSKKERQEVKASQRSPKKRNRKKNISQFLMNGKPTGYPELKKEPFSLLEKKNVSNLTTEHTVRPYQEQEGPREQQWVLDNWTNTKKSPFSNLISLEEWQQIGNENVSNLTTEHTVRPYQEQEGPREQQWVLDNWTNTKKSPFSNLISLEEWQQIGNENVSNLTTEHTVRPYQEQEGPREQQWVLDNWTNTKKSPFSNLISLEEWQQIGNENVSNLTTEHTVRPYQEQEGPREQQWVLDNWTNTKKSPFSNLISLEEWQQIGNENVSNLTTEHTVRPYQEQEGPREQQWVLDNWTNTKKSPFSNLISLEEWQQISNENVSNLTTEHTVRPYQEQEGPREQQWVLDNWTNTKKSPFSNLISLEEWQQIGNENVSNLTTEHTVRPYQEQEGPREQQWVLDNWTNTKKSPFSNLISLEEWQQIGNENVSNLTTEHTVRPYQEQEGPREQQWVLDNWTNTKKSPFSNLISLEEWQQIGNENVSNLTTEHTVRPYQEQEGPREQQWVLDNWTNTKQSPFSNLISLEEWQQIGNENVSNLTTEHTVRPYQEQEGPREQQWVLDNWTNTKQSPFSNLISLEEWQQIGNENVSNLTTEHTVRPYQEQEGPREQQWVLDNWTNTKQSPFSNLISLEEWQQIESVFAPNDIDLDDAKMDDAEREVEAFKRFCLESVPPKHRVKVHFDIKDIVLDKKLSIYN